MSEKYKLIYGDALEQVRQLASESVDCAISSPPYWQLRDYGFAEQWGLEPTFGEYLEKLWALMDEVKRVLKPTGTVWINLGDTYGTQSGAMRDGNFGEKNTNNQSFIQPKSVHKSLLLIPHRFAIGCSERGWIIRNDIVWAKRNGMPESVTDRFSKKHEYFFLMAKQAKYFFDLDAVRDEHKEDSIKRACRAQHFNGSEPYAFTRNSNYRGYENKDELLKSGELEKLNAKGKNPGDVADFWDIPTRPSSAKHYATYNTQLIDKPIKAGCPENGVILDMFCGTATTGVRALELGRKFIGIDGNAEYLAEARARLDAAVNAQPLFKTGAA